MESKYLTTTTKRQRKPVGKSQKRLPTFIMQKSSVLGFTDIESRE